MSEEKQPESTALTVLEQATFKEVGGLGKMFGMEMPGQVLANVLASTAFSGGERPTLEQLTALVVVARQYHLNPFTKEIYAFPDKKKGIVPIVGVDGWIRIINEHAAFDGMEFRESEERTKPEPSAQEAPVWMECVMYRTDRKHPIVIREYLDEVYRKKGNYDGPWQTHTKRFFRHKTMIQAARVAFGFAGIYDQDEAERIIEGQEIELQATGGDKALPTRPKARSAQPKADETPQTQERTQEATVNERAQAADREEVTDAEFEPVDETTEQQPNGDALAGEAEAHQPEEQPDLLGDDWKPKPGEASQGMIDFIRKKGEAKGYDAIAICQQFGLNALRGISEEKANEILGWIKKAPAKTPVEA
jgi:phage recombination protein Bet